MKAIMTVFSPIILLSITMIIAGKDSIIARPGTFAQFMNLKHLPHVLFELELAKARLKVAELSAQLTESEIYEGVCQNLVLVHFKLAATSIVAHPGIDIQELSSLLLQSVRDLRKLSRKGYADSNIQNKAQLTQHLISLAGLLKLSELEIKTEGNFSKFSGDDFLYIFFALQHLVAGLAMSGRIPASILIKDDGSRSLCIIKYVGLPVIVSRLSSAYHASDSVKSDFNSELLRRFGGTISSCRGVDGKFFVNLVIPVLK